MSIISHFLQPQAEALAHCMYTHSVMVQVVSAERYVSQCSAELGVAKGVGLLLNDDRRAARSRVEEVLGQLAIPKHIFVFEIS